MSDQSQGIPVHYIPSQFTYRLIELPPDLQSLLESDSAPVLKLETSDTSALLKTPSKTYALRQKNTSNALMLLSPTPPLAADSPQEGMAIVSTIHETVELDVVPEKPAGASGDVPKNLGSKGKWHERFGRNR